MKIIRIEDWILKKHLALIKIEGLGITLKFTKRHFIVILLQHFLDFGFRVDNTSTY